jgi:uncharacterized membrane protein YciS (DUF1049 family)
MLIENIFALNLIVGIVGIVCGYFLGMLNSRDKVAYLERQLKNQTETIEKLKFHNRCLESSVKHYENKNKENKNG